MVRWGPGAGRAQSREPCSVCPCWTAGPPAPQACSRAAAPGPALSIWPGVPVPKPVLGNCNGYTAAPGDTLFTIAAAFQTTTDNLVAANPSLAEGVLSPGTLVYIPP